MSGNAILLRVKAAGAIVFARAEIRNDYMRIIQGKRVGYWVCADYISGLSIYILGISDYI